MRDFPTRPDEMLSSLWRSYRLHSCLGQARSTGSLPWLCSWFVLVVIQPNLHARYSHVSFQRRIQGTLEYRK